MIVNKYANGGGGGYVLPTATDSRLGGVKVGSGLTVQNDGTLSAEGGAVPVATTGSTGVIKVGSGLTVDSGGTLETEIKHIDLNNTTQEEKAAINHYMVAHSADTLFEITIDNPDGDHGPLTTTYYGFGGDGTDIYMTFYCRGPQYYCYCLSTNGDFELNDSGNLKNYNNLTNKPVVNGFELSGSTFPIWTGRDLKECFGLMDASPYGGMPSYTGHKVVVPEGEYETGTKTGSTILVEYEVVYDESTHYQDCGTITSDRNGTVRTISFQVEYNQSENYWKLQYKNDTAETWTDFDSLTPNKVGWAPLYGTSWTSQQYVSYVRIHTDDSYMGRLVFDFVPDLTSNWDLGKYATWTLPQDAVYSEIVATGIRRSNWRSTKIYVKYDKNQNFIEGCYDTEKYYIFVTSAGTVTSSTLTDYEKLEGYQDISGHTTFYDSETKHKWGVGVLDDNGKVYSSANLIFYCDFNGGYQTTTPSLEGYVNVNVNGTMTTYHGKWQKQSYGSWQTLLWEPYAPVQSSGVSTIWKGSQAEYDALSPDYDNNTLYVIV